MLKLEFIKDLVKKDTANPLKKRAKVGQNYYDANNDIERYRFFYYDKNGMLQEDTIRSNVKISHPFFRELVDQKVQYMLSKFDIGSDDENLDLLLHDYFDDEFKDELNELLIGVSIKGFDYMYQYMGNDMKTRFAYADGFNVIELPAKQSPDNKDYIIYYYGDVYGVDGESIIRIEVSDKEKRYYYYIDEHKEIKEDPFVEYPERPHILYTKGDGKLYTRPAPFTTVPFYRLDNGKKKESDLFIVKAIIDDYDLMNCGLSNNIQDMGEGFIAVKGFEGDNIDELYTNLRTKKTIGVGRNGDVEVRTVNIPYEARKEKLVEDEKNIYRFGMGFNSNQVGDGNITNIVLKSRYVLLELKCNKFEKPVRRYLKQLVEIVLEEINQQQSTSYTMHDVNICLDREVMTNALDNAQIEQIKAQTEQAKINTLLSVLNAFGGDNEELIKSICEYLELDYTKVSNQLEESFLVDTNDAETALNRLNNGDDVVE